MRGREGSSFSVSFPARKKGWVACGNMKTSCVPLEGEASCLLGRWRVSVGGRMLCMRGHY